MRQRLAIVLLTSLISAGVISSYGASVLYGQLTQAEIPQPQQSVVTPVPGSVPPAAAGAPTVPAVVTTTVQSPAAPQNPLDQVMWALALSLALRYVMKKGWLPFLTTAAEPRVKAFVGFLVAAGTAAGIHFVVNGSPFDGHGATITVSGLSFDAIKDVGFQWVSQQAWYEALVKKNLV